MQLHIIQAQCMANILKAAIAAIAKYAHLRPRFGVHNRRQIDPSIVVDIDGSKAPSAERSMKRQFHALKPPAYVIRAFHVPPQCQARRASVRHGNVHPAVFVEVQYRNAHGWRQLLAFIQRLRGVFAFARIHIDQRRRTIACDRQIHCAIIVEIRENRRSGLPTPAQPGWLCPLGESLVAVVAPQDV